MGILYPEITFAPAEVSISVFNRVTIDGIRVGEPIITLLGLDYTQWGSVDFGAKIKQEQFIFHSTSEVIGETAGNAGAYLQRGGLHTVDTDISLGLAGYELDAAGSVVKRSSIGAYQLDTLDPTALLRVRRDMLVGVGGQGELAQRGGQIVVERNLVLGRDGGLRPELRSMGALSMWGGLLDVGGDLEVGYGGIGNLSLNLGQVTVAGDAVFGRLAGSRGEATTNILLNSLFHVKGQMIVGDLGKGVAHFDGLANPLEVDGDLILGKSRDSSGNAGDGFMRLSALNITLVGNDVVIGDTGVGAMEVSGSGMAVQRDLVIGRSVAGSGSMALAAGQITAHGNLLVGDAGQGTLTALASPVTVAGSLNVGVAASGRGLVEISTSTDLNVTGAVQIGVAGDGTVSDSGGMLRASGVVVGAQYGSNGTLALTGGAFWHPGNLTVGDAGNGTLTIGSAGYGRMAAGSTEIGRQAGGVGLVHLDGGEFKATDVGIGGAGSGRWEQAGGLTELTGSLTFRGNSALALSGGTMKSPSVTIQPGSSLAVTGGGLAWGSIFQTGGSLAFGPSTELTLTNNATSTATHRGLAYSLLGGTLTVPTLRVDGGSFTQNGGSLVTDHLILESGLISGVIESAGDLTIGEGAVFLGKLKTSGTFTLGRSLAVPEGIDSSGTTLIGAGGSITGGDFAVKGGTTTVANGGSIATPGITSTDAGSLVFASGGNFSGAEFRQTGGQTEVQAGATFDVHGPLKITGGSLTFGAGSDVAVRGLISLDSILPTGSAWILNRDFTIETGRAMNWRTELGGQGTSRLAGSGTLTVANGSTLDFTGGGLKTLDATILNQGLMVLYTGNLSGDGRIANEGVFRIGGNVGRGVTITNQGTLSAADTDALSGVNVNGRVTNTSAGKISAFAGTMISFNGSLDNAGLLDVDGILRTQGNLVHTGTARINGSLLIEGGGDSTGRFVLSGGQLVFGAGDFTVTNARTQISGEGTLNFLRGNTNLDYGVTDAPVTISQKLVFSGGNVVLPGATSLLTSDLTLRGSNISPAQGDLFNPGQGSTPDLPTTVTSGGSFVWAGGTVRNTLTLEPGVGSSTVALIGGSRSSARIDGTLINRTSLLDFQGTDGGAMKGTGTLRNEGTMNINLSEFADDRFVGSSSWLPNIENTGTATLQGATGNTNSPTYVVGNGGGFSGLVTNSGSLTISGDVRVANLTQTGGTTTLQGAPRIAGLWDIQGGVLNAPTGVYFAGSIDISAEVNFGGAALVESGIVNRVGGTVQVHSSLVAPSSLLLNNLGTVILDGPNAMLLNVGTDRLFGLLQAGSNMDMGIIAGGTLEIRNGANVPLASGMAGAADLRVGNEGTLTFSGGKLTGAGTLSILAGGRVNQTGGELFRSTEIGGIYDWNGGSWSSGGITTIISGGTLTTSGSGSHDFIYRSIVNNGTVNWNGGALQSGAGGSVTNNGVFNDAASAVINTHGYYGGAFSFTNTGTYNKTAAGTTTIEIPFTNSGTVNVEAGTLRLAGGGAFSGGGTVSVAADATLAFASDYMIPDASRLAGGGTFLFTQRLTLAGDVNVPGFQMTAGTLAGSHTFNNAVLWNGANLSAGGTTTIGTTGTLTMSGSNSHDFVFRTIVNNGTTNWTGGALQSGAGGSFTNNGTLNDSASASIFTAGYYGGPFSFTNTGTYNKTAAGTTTFEVPFANSGVVNLAAGTLRLAGGGAFSGAGTVSAAVGATLDFASDYTIPDAGRLAGGGTFLFTQRLNLSGDVNVAGFQMTAGTLAGSHTFNGAVLWNGANLSSGGTTTIGATGTLTMSGSNSHDFVFRMIVNNGTTNWTGGALQSGAGGSFTNNGTLNDSASASIFAAGYYGGPFSFTNTGTYNKTAAGTTDIQIPFANTGAVNVQAGQLNAGGVVSGGGLSGGTWRVADGARLVLDSDAAISRNAATVVLTGANSLFNGLNNLTSNAGSLSLLDGRVFSTGAAFTNSGTLVVGPESVFSTSGTFANTGTLDISGTLAAGGGLTNSGVVHGAGQLIGGLVSSGELSPGNSPGVLTVDGNLTLLATSVLTMELGGSVAGVSYDHLNVGGVFTAGGGLELALINSFTPGAGASFDLFDAASFQGSFSDIVLPTLPVGLSWDTTGLFSNGVVSVAAVPEPATWALMAGGVGLMVIFHRSRRVR